MFSINEWNMLQCAVIAQWLKQSVMMLTDLIYTTSKKIPSERHAMPQMLYLL